jgi:hypothetical protein
MSLQALPALVAQSQEQRRRSVRKGEDTENKTSLETHPLLPSLVSVTSGLRGHLCLHALDPGGLPLRDQGLPVLQYCGTLPTIINLRENPLKDR